MKKNAMKFLCPFFLMVMFISVVGCSSNPIVGTGNWVFSAVSIPEQAKEAELVVQVTIEKRENQNKIVDVPVYENDQVTVKKYEKMQQAYTGYKAKVVKLYKGQHQGNELDLLQHGGQIDFFTRVEEWNPLLEVGKSYVLFLNDISGDKVLAPGKTMYIPINSASIYQVNGNQVALSVLEGPSDKEKEQLASLPTTLTDLEQAIVSQK